MKRMALIAVAGLVVLTVPAAAQELFVDAPIRAVTVYPQGALVTREGPFSLLQGNTTIVIDHIPTGIDASSVRVGGASGEGVQIQSVVVRAGKPEEEENPERERIVAAIEELRDQLLFLADEAAALEAQREFIGHLIDEGPGGFAQLLGTQGGGIDQWQRAWLAIGEGLTQVQAEIRRVSFERRDIEAEITELLDDLAGLPSEPQHLEIVVEIAAAAAAEGALVVSYRVNNARWTPVYDAYLTTGDADVDPMVTLIRRAEITQTTGEDWTNVAITLSTTRPSGGTEAATVGEALIGVYDMVRAGAPMYAAEMAADAVGLAAPAPIPQQEAVADFGDFRADYIVPVPVSVTSGGGARAVQLATDEATARLFVEVAPRYAEQAFLTAAFTLDSEAAILAGRVNLFRDDSYVGSSNLAFASPGEEVELGFGADDQVHVVWTLVNRSSGERGLLTRFAFDELEYRATITNGHSRAIEITVVDRMPVSNDERIVVERLPQTTEPTEEDVGGRRGVLAWTYEYEPGETRDIVNAYAVTWPADLGVFGVE